MSRIQWIHMASGFPLLVKTQSNSKFMLATPQKQPQITLLFKGINCRFHVGFEEIRFVHGTAFPKAKSTARYPGTKHFFIAFCWGKDQIVSQFIYPQNTKWLPPWISMSNRFSEINLTLDGFFAYGKNFTFQPKKKSVFPLFHPLTRCFLGFCCLFL